MKRFQPSHPITLFIAIFISLPIFSQGKLEDFQRAEKFLRPNVEKMVFQSQVKPNWIEKSNRFWYKSTTAEGKNFILVDAMKRSKRSAFNHQKLAMALSILLKKEYKPFDLPFDTVKFIEKGRAITFKVDSKKIQCQLKTYECKEIEEKKKDDSISLSPDGKWEAFVKDYNLYIRSAKDKQLEIQLTSDGTEKYAYGLAWDWYLLMNESDPSQTKESKRISVKWSSDSKKILTQRVDERKSKKLYLYQSTPKKGYRAQVWSYYRSLPGETEGTMFEYLIFDIPSKKKTTIDLPPLQSTISWGMPTWFKDGKRLHFFYFTRGYKKVSLLEIDAQTGKTRNIYSESAQTYIDTDKTMYEVLGEGKELVWGSERSGWSQLYLYDWQTGKLKNVITSGEYVVRSILHVDEKKRKLYFMANGREQNCDPYLQYLYRINLDGTGLTLLTPENAEHWVRLSEDKKYIVDSYSRVDMAPISVLRRLRDGKLLMTLERANIKKLLATGWHYPEPFQVKARDGKTDIYGAIFRPSNFDSAKTYPVIDATYSGPQAVKTPKTFWRGIYNDMQAIAELGFIVVTVDGLGTAQRSKEFHDFSYKNLGDIGAPDHIAAFKQLAKKYCYFDLSRVGIYGLSAGGYDAAHALLTQPEFYKVAVSVSGNHDHQMAKAWWPELYMGFPVDKHYVAQSNLTLAKNLKGKLFLICGDMDNNVNPASTLRFASELIKADKDFDLLIMPNEKHWFGNNPYFVRRRWDYFVKHLLGVDPPHYKIETKLK
jgi:dipeptidyl-peptidase 4